MFPTSALVSLCLLAVVYGQQAGTLTTETHPTLPIEQCAAGGACTTLQTTVVLDSNWRWLHQTTSDTNCYTGNTWDTTLCPDPTTCAANCALDGADYADTYGVTTSGNSLRLNFVTDASTGTNVGSRLYLMASETEYQMFSLLNQEFTFTVNMANLGCGLNGALYFSEMDADGGMARFSGNKAGAKFGTGYCDSQCPHDIKFINGAANILNWTADANSANSGTGMYGTCCSEMDIWEANSMAEAYTPHPCSVTEQTQCSGTQCDGISGPGLCDPAGCDFNSWRMGNQTFLGPGKIIDTTQPITVVTQFITADNTTTGTLSEIRRIYVQNGVTIQNSFTNIAGISPPVNAISDTFCTQQKTAVGDSDYFETLGGLTTIGGAIGRGMVLALSIWDDYAADMLWLDSDYPTTANPSAPGVNRGPCATTSGVPAAVESSQASDYVEFSNIKFGPLGSTFGGSTTGTPPPVSSVSSTPPSAPTGGTIPEYDQCGGINWTGSGTCVAGTTCQELNAYYFQCLA